MSFTATCPFCGATYPNIDEAHLGDTARCKRCGQQFVVRQPRPEVGEAVQRARQLKVPFVRVAAIPIDPAVATSLPRDVLTKCKAIPVGRHGEDLIVAMANPVDLLAVDDLRRLNPHVRAVLALEAEITEALAALPSPEALAAAQSARELAAVAGSLVAAQALQELRAQAEPSADEPTVTPEAEEDSSPAKQAMDHILSSATAMGAAEVRIMEGPEGIVVQGRTDSGLQPIEISAEVAYRRLIGRLKAAAGCDPTKRGEAQSGSIPFAHEGTEVEFLLSILPARGLERAQLRVVDAAQARQRRAVERRQKIDALLAELADRAWPLPEAHVDPSGAKEFLYEMVDGQPAPTRLVLAVLVEALGDKAREIVFEPHGKGLRVLVRSTAEHFEPKITVPDYARRTCVARLQIMANIDLAYVQESRQGVLYVMKDGQAHEVRVATLPSDIGQIMVAHIVQH